MATNERERERAVVVLQDCVALKIPNVEQLGLKIVALSKEQ